jgi:Flp pilus assembly protein TadG
MIHRSTRSQRRRLARSIVEFVLVGPVFLLLLMGIFEYARFLFTLQLMDNAAREGARYASVNTATATTATVQSYVDGYLVGQGGTQLVNYSSTSNIAVYKADPATGGNTGLSWQNATWGSGVGVSVSGTYQPFTPGLLLLTGSLSVSASCVISCEAN